MHASFSDPQKTILQCGLAEGMKVGDFGAGSGHYARAAAGIVGANGKVYAVDIQEDVLKHLKLNTHDRHRSTIETVWGDVETRGGTHLRDASLDAVIIANILFQIDNRAGFVEEIRRVLKPGGKLIVVDWAGSYDGMGPPAPQVVSPHDTEALFTSIGFTEVKTLDAGAHHYGMLFTAPLSV